MKRNHNKCYRISFTCDTELGDKLLVITQFLKDEGMFILLNAVIGYHRHVVLLFLNKSAMRRFKYYWKSHYTEDFKLIKYVNPALYDTLHDYEELPITNYSHIRFYAEYADISLKRKDFARDNNAGRPYLQYNTGNVLAVWPIAAPEYSSYGAHTQSRTDPNTMNLQWGSVDHEYLETKCFRISFEDAVTLHPNLFLSNVFDIKES